MKPCPVSAARRCVLVVAPQPVIAAALALFIQQRGDFEAASCTVFDDIASQIAIHHPAVVVIYSAVSLPDVCLHTCSRVAAASATPCVLLLVPAVLIDDCSFSIRAFAAGADGVLDCDRDSGEAIINAVQHGADGLPLWNNYLPQEERSVGTPILDGGQQLTEREHEVLRLIGTGMQNSTISACLCISERTVQKHVSNILAKLDVRSRSQAVAWYYRSERNIQARE